jgi:hypothetical protein
MVQLSTLQHVVLVLMNDKRDADFVKFKQREEEIDAIKSQFKQIQIRLETLGEINAEYEDQAR